MRRAGAFGYFAVALATLGLALAVDLKPRAALGTNGGGPSGGSSTCSGDINSGCSQLNRATGNVGGVFAVTSPVQIGASGPFAGTGAAIRLPWIGAAGNSPYFTERDHANTQDLNVLGSTTDNGGTLNIADINWPLTQTHGQYVDFDIQNNVQIFWHQNNNDILQVGENGGGAFAIADTNGDGFTTYTWTTHKYDFNTGTTTFFNGGLFGSSVPEITFGPTGIQLGTVNVAITTGTATLSATQYPAGKINLTGSLTGDVTVVWPSSAVDGTCWDVDPTALTLNGHAVSASINGHVWGTTLGNTNEAHLCYNGTKFYGVAYTP